MVAAAAAAAAKMESRLRVSVLILISRIGLDDSAERRSLEWNRQCGDYNNCIRQ